MLLSSCLHTTALSKWTRAQIQLNKVVLDEITQSMLCVCVPLAQASCDQAWGGHPSQAKRAPEKCLLDSGNPGSLPVSFYPRHI